MRIAPGPLLTFLNSAKQVIMVDLFTFELRNGQTLRYCTHSSPVTFAGLTWLPAPAGLTRSKIRWATGVEVDTLDIVFQADSSILIGSVPLMAAAVKAQFDNARVTLARLFMSDWNTPVDAVTLFQGSTAPAEALRTALRLTVKSALDGLNVQIPADVFQVPCVHKLYDSGCGVNVATYRVTGTVAAINADGSLALGLAQADKYFQMGALKFTSGQNTGLTRTVKSYAGGTVYLTSPFPFPVALGDAFTITPGCDKIRTGDCTNKFANTARFTAFEFIPAPETAA